MMALVLAVAVVLSMSVTLPAFAAGEGSSDTVKIEIERDTTYDGTGDGNTYTWYKVFSASYASNTATKGGHDATGNPLETDNTATAVSYTATSDVAGKLGSWNATDKKWTRAEGNLWFDLTPIAGSDNYSVKWVNANTDSATAQAAAKWLYENKVWEKTGSLTQSDGKFSATGLEKGYYLINGVTGKNLVAATTDITIKEKNEYPSDDKKQKDADDGTTFGDEAVNVAVGDVINYEVTVHIPATARVGDLIVVWDKASDGLTYNDDVAVKDGTNEGNATIGDVDTNDQVADATWQKLITVTEGSQNTDVVFEFTMTVNSDALTDTQKKNESGLKYGNDSGNGTHTFPYESTPDKVEFKTYFAGIEKVDGQNPDTKLANVEFTIKEGNAEFKVSKPDGKDYYVYDANGSSTVKTDAYGLIKIRGLDSDKTYTLTETKNPNEGYNMLAEPATLTLKLDTYGSISYDKATEYDAAETYYTKDGDNYTEATVADAEAFAAGTFFTKTEISGSVYDATTADKFDDVINNKGTVLPSTGGIGTTIFYVVGALLVIGAGVLLVTRRRMRAE